jgi:hypothetical protein
MSTQDGANGRTELLKHLSTEQWEELNHRREREEQMFAWSTAVFLAVIGGLLVAELPEDSFLRSWGKTGRAIACAVILVFTYFSVWWQRRQRIIASGHKRVLARVQAELGCFTKPEKSDSLYPAAWKEWGTEDQSWNRLLARPHKPSKVLVTILFGVVAAAVIWLPRTKLTGESASTQPIPTTQGAATPATQTAAPPAVDDRTRANAIAKISREPALGGR